MPPKPGLCTNTGNFVTTAHPFANACEQQVKHNVRLSNTHNRLNTGSSSCQLTYHHTWLQTLGDTSAQGNIPQKTTTTTTKNRTIHKNTGQRCIHKKGQWWCAIESDSRQDGQHREFSHEFPGRHSKDLQPLCTSPGLCSVHRETGYKTNWSWGQCRGILWLVVQADSICAWWLLHYFCEALTSVLGPCTPFLWPTHLFFFLFLCIPFLSLF